MSERFISCVVCSVRFRGRRAWIVEPFADVEDLRVAEIDHQRVNEERQNMDPVGHYSRPDVTRLIVDRKRQSTVQFEE